jgi:pyruvate-formate lyase-activating enzyme
MEIKIKREIENLMKMNIPESMAMIIVYKKYNKLDELNSIIEVLKEEQKEIAEEIDNFVPFNSPELIKS